MNFSPTVHVYAFFHKCTFLVLKQFMNFFQKVPFYALFLKMTAFINLVYAPADVFFMYMVHHIIDDTDKM